MLHIFGAYVSKRFACLEALSLQPNSVLAYCTLPGAVKVCRIVCRIYIYSERGADGCMPRKLLAIGERNHVAVVTYGKQGAHEPHGDGVVFQIADKIRP